jgi:hypothetical protein
VGSSQTAGKVRCRCGVAIHLLPLATVQAPPRLSALQVLRNHEPTRKAIVAACLVLWIMLALVFNRAFPSQTAGTLDLVALAGLWIGGAFLNHRVKASKLQDHPADEVQAAQEAFRAEKLRAKGKCPQCRRKGLWAHRRVDGTADMRYKQNYLVCPRCDSAL